MKEIYWNFAKSIELKDKRDITFEQLINSRFVGIEKHPTRKNQNLMLFELHKYIWVVLYIEEKNYYFLKTAFPSRKHTKKIFRRDLI